MTGESFRRLPFRLTEVAFAVNPRILKVQFQQALRPLLRDRVRARELLAVSADALENLEKKANEGAFITVGAKPRERLIKSIREFLESTR